MARTKQTARKSTGGRAPRKQLAAKAARQFRQYMVGQQSVGHGAAGMAGQSKVSIVNYENTFAGFQFGGGIHPSTATTEEVFQPVVHTHEVLPFEGDAAETYMSLSFRSKFDGNGIRKLGRPSVCVALVLDVSGSMISTFEDDDDRVSKLEVAKASIRAICKQLTPKDEAGLVVFNHSQSVALPITTMTKAGKNKLISSAERLMAGGGTDLSEGYLAGLGLVEKHGSEAEMKRVVFITDMQSGPSDEAAVIDSTRKAASKGVHTTVVGVGVDLSVATVQQLSSIPGGRYMSANSCGEFSKVVADEFAYDVTPIAFDIRAKLAGQDWVLVKGYGSPEVNGIKQNSKNISLSSEFPSPRNPDGSSAGSMLLFKLNRSAKSKCMSPPPVKVDVEWRDVQGIRQTAQLHAQSSAVVHTNTSEPIQSSAPSPGTDIRKAVALVRYVDLQAEYVLADDDHSLNGGGDGGGGGGGRKRKRNSGEEGGKVHMDRVQRFTRFRDWFKNEMKICGDDSIREGNGPDTAPTTTTTSSSSTTTTAHTGTGNDGGGGDGDGGGGGGSNQAIINTLNQMIQIETTEHRAVVTAARVASGSTPDTPSSYRCAITQELMTDPVMAQDGHTYERSAIERWFREHRPATSPNTGQTLGSKALFPNHAIRAAIDEWKSRPPQPTTSTTTTTTTTSTTTTSSSSSAKRARVNTTSSSSSRRNRSNSRRSTKAKAGAKISSSRRSSSISNRGHVSTSGGGTRARLRSDGVRTRSTCRT